MPAVRSTPVVQVHPPHLTHPWPADGPPTLRVSSAVLPPYSPAFVHVDVGPGITLGISVIPGPLRHDGTQDLAARTTDDRALVSLAARLKNDDASRPWSLRVLHPTTPHLASVIPFPTQEVARVS